MKILAITGGSGSGKSTVLRALADHLGARASMLSLDDYYRPKEELPVDGNGETNFDVPEAIDHVALHRDILKLGRGEQVSFQSYTYNKDLMTSELTVVEPREWLIVEGLFVMCYPDVVEMADVKAFIHASPEIRLARRKDRDLNVRGLRPRGGGLPVEAPRVSSLQRAHRTPPSALRRGHRQRPRLDAWLESTH